MKNFAPERPDIRQGKSSSLSGGPSRGLWDGRRVFGGLVNFGLVAFDFVDFGLIKSGLVNLNLINFGLVDEELA
jgi:hypothetical protein